MENRLITIVNRFLQEEICDDNREKKLRELGLDSMASIELLIEIEQELNIQIPDIFLTPKTFRTFNNLSEAISEILNSK